jgi:hypothetical protein
MSDVKQGGTFSGGYVGQDRPEPTGWLGFAIYAALMLLIIGGFAAIEGLVALFNDDYYALARAGWSSTSTSSRGAASTSASVCLPWPPASGSCWAAPGRAWSASSPPC